MSVLGLSYGAFVLAFGVSFWQALVAGVIGIVVSFLLCGFIAVAGKRGSAPTMVLSRAAFGLRGNRLPSALSWLLTVGWETALTALATLGDGDRVRAAALGRRHPDQGGRAHRRGRADRGRRRARLRRDHADADRDHRADRRADRSSTSILVAHHIHWHTVSALPSGSNQNFIGALIFMMTGFGLGWVNAAADYSRYLPRRSSTAGVIGWTTFGSAVAPVVLLVFGLLLAGSSKDLSAAISADPIGALTTELPTWFLVPFAVVAVLGLVGGAVLDIYSSGLALLAAGLRAPRFLAAFVDGVIMVLGTIYIVFIGKNFLVQFEGVLITLGVPVAAWCGVMLADILWRRRDYAETDLYRADGRYGDVRVFPIALVVVGTALGWGLVTNTSASWLSWQGYLLDVVGLGRQGRRLGLRQPGRPGGAGARVRRDAASTSRGRIRAQESAPASDGRLEWTSGRSRPRRGRRSWLAVIDVQHVFADAASPWAAPRFAEIVAPGARLVDAFGDRSTFTRFVAPRDPAGAWRAYYADWPFALVAADDPLYRLGAGVHAPSRRRARSPSDHVRQVGRPRRPDRDPRVGPARRVRRLDRLLRAVHRPGRGRRRGRGARGGRRLRRRHRQSHQRALDAMSLYAPARAHRQHRRVLPPRFGPAGTTGPADP